MKMVLIIGTDVKKDWRGDMEPRQGPSHRLRLSPTNDFPHSAFTFGTECCCSSSTITLSSVG
jgi:hypothetical protein